MLLTTDGLPNFSKLIKGAGPDAHLVDCPECLALFHYSQMAVSMIDRQRNGIQYEGNLTNTYNFKKMFGTVATMWDADPNVMLNFWPWVDKQCDAKGYTKVPQEYQYRFVFGSQGQLLS